MKSGKYEKVEDALYMWMNDARLKGIPLSGPILKEKWAHFVTKIEGLNIEMSEGLLNRFKSHHSVWRLWIVGEILSADINSVEPIKINILHNFANIDPLAALKVIDIVDVIHWFSNARDNISPLTLVKSWKRLLDHKVDYDDIDNAALNIIEFVAAIPDDRKIDRETRV